ncbi:hypothetical protein ScPMuIL_000190, partial [Solemya velum]
MPECVTCGAEDFDLVDGLYYCNTCQTQTQEILDEQVDSFDPNARLIFIRKEKGGIQEEQKVNKGRPWSIIEGFQIIIKAQVQALIKLGAKKELEDLVLRMWILYLQKSGRAFLDEQSKDDSPVIKHDRLREKYPGTCEDPGVSPVRYRRTYRKNHVESMHTMTVLSLPNEEFFEGDDPREVLKDIEMDSECLSETDMFEPSSVDKQKVETDTVLTVSNEKFYKGDNRTEGMSNVDLQSEVSFHTDVSEQSDSDSEDWNNKRKI